MLDEAEAAYEKLSPDAKALKARANFMLRRGKPQEARKILEDLLARDPADVDAAVQLAQLLGQQGAAEAALQGLEKSLRADLKPSDPERILVAKASLKAAQGDWNEAIGLSQRSPEADSGEYGCPSAPGKAPPRNRQDRRG